MCRYGVQFRQEAIRKNTLNKNRMNDKADGRHWHGKTSTPPSLIACRNVGPAGPLAAAEEDPAASVRAVQRQQPNHQAAAQVAQGPRERPDTSTEAASCASRTYWDLSGSVAGHDAVDGAAAGRSQDRQGYIAGKVAPVDAGVGDSWASQARSGEVEPVGGAVGVEQGVGWTEGREAQR